MTCLHKYRHVSPTNQSKMSVVNETTQDGWPPPEPSPPPTEKFGIIITRHMSNEDTASYWMLGIRAIRVHYPELPIVVIDDNSDPKFLTATSLSEEKQLYKCRVVYSIYKKRGELLPYYYYALESNAWFENALIIHDSVFIVQPLSNMNTVFDILDNRGFLFLWHFSGGALRDDPLDETTLIGCLKNGDDIVETIYADSNTWNGCFGSMAFISRKFLLKLNDVYNLSTLVNNITTRRNRMSFERLIACTMIHACHDAANKSYQTEVSYLGNIHMYCKWDMKFHEVREEITRACFQNKKYITNETNLSIIKVWSGR
jgi:hypothetical protein